jgi:single-strand DNA-binding protein
MQKNNQVSLVGRVSADPVERELPSGDRVVSLRVVVDRPDNRRSTRKQVDVIDLSSWTKTTQRSALRLKPNDMVEAQGSLRRRFFNTPGGRTSRYEVELARIKRISPQPRE